DRLRQCLLVPARRHRRNAAHPERAASASSRRRTTADGSPQPAGAFLAPAAHARAGRRPRRGLRLAAARTGQLAGARRRPTRSVICRALTVGSAASAGNQSIGVRDRTGGSSTAFVRPRPLGAVGDDPPPTAPTWTAPAEGGDTGT